MKLKVKPIVFFIIFSNAFNSDQALNHSTFPPNFVFGTGSSAYQIEGAWNISGKEENIWDYATHNTPQKIIDRSNGDVACDSFHKIDEDIASLKFLNVDFYSFSISWTRLLSETSEEFVNPEGARYCNELIDKLIANNITPMVTLYHWDLFQSVQVSGGWLNAVTLYDYNQFVTIAFELFGDRVKQWITFNDPFSICVSSYEDSALAPFHHLPGLGLYVCVHNLLLAHASAYHIYKNQFFDKQQGKIGIVVNSPWFIPATNSKQDKEAANRALKMHVDWFLHPLLSKNGNYPKIMQERIDKSSKEQKYTNSRLPNFTAEEILRIRNSTDFIGINHYSSYLVSDTKWILTKPPSFQKDVAVKFSYDSSWNNTARENFKVYPEGIRHILNYIKDKYNNPVVYISGNGYAGFQNETTEDDARIWYHKAYLNEVLKAINEDNCNVQSYSVWSLMDSFEWTHGYTLRFGSFYVDFNDTDRTRIPKKSAFQLSQIFQTHRIN